MIFGVFDARWTGLRTTRNTSERWFKMSVADSTSAWDSGRLFRSFLLRKMAGVTGLEPAASGVTGQRSNQLSYTP